MDLLSEVLSLSGVRGTLGARIDAGEDWGWWAPAAPGAAIHTVTAGTAWLGRRGEEPVQLMPGDVVLLPGGAEHVLASDPDALARTTRTHFDPAAEVREGVYAIGSGPVRSRILCAHYEHDPSVTTQVLGLLPPLVHLRADHAGGGLEDTVRLLARELVEPGLASSTLLDRLIDVLLVQLLRIWVASRPPSPEPSFLGVLADPVVGAAVARLHEDPARAWTTELLAAELSVSRATLARRFPAVVGESPAAYLARWRMDLAARRLRDTDDALDAVARSVGYTSVHAFSRAFSRARSVPPGRWRAEARRAAAGRGLEPAAAGA